MKNRYLSRVRDGGLTTCSHRLIKFGSVNSLTWFWQY